MNVFIQLSMHTEEKMIVVNKLVFECSSPVPCQAGCFDLSSGCQLAAMFVCLVR